MLSECELESQKSLMEKMCAPMYSSQIGPKLSMQQQKLPTNAQEVPEHDSFKESEKQAEVQEKVIKIEKVDKDSPLPFELQRVQRLDPKIKRRLVDIAKRKRKCIDQSFDSVPDSQKKTCNICLGQYAPIQMKSPLSCEHEFCSTCVEKYLNDSIEKGNVLKISCPTKCNQDYTEEIIKQIVSPKMFDKYKRFYYKQKISLDPNVRWCPRLNCDKYVTGSLLRTKLQCECGQLICFSCGNEYHQNLSCSQAEDQQYREAKEEYKIYECPLCRAPIQKKSGCNHMTCYKCKHQFCWLCQGDYNSYHYVVFNIFGCILPGAQTLNAQPFKHAMALRILMAIPKIILTILLASLLLASLPFIILYYILAVPYIICKNSSGFRLRRYYGWKYVFSWLGFLFLGILLSPITVAGALIASPFLLVKLVRDLWC
ncbi:hypothetical protein pb186bvf_011467 [Paramecium bursaria]